MSQLKSRIVARIQQEGPMSVASYMAVCLFDATHGFYSTRDPLGADGDFITAPEISQMFGELIGLWCVQSWRDMERPQHIQLIEMGPGRGIMMSDILRAASVDEGFLKAVNVTLVEASPALEAVQAQTLSGAPCPVSWAGSLETAPEGPAIIIGNEFLDCLPIRQFVRKGEGSEGAWHERMVFIDPSDETQLIFGLSPTADTIEDFTRFENISNEPLKNGDLIEICPSLAQITQTLAQRFSDDPGRALFIDYGPDYSEIGDTLQALKSHTKVDPLSEPGDADLTARVDFSALSDCAYYNGLMSFGPQTQAHFLAQLGIEARAARLALDATEEAKATLMRQFHRLTESSEMGELFKAVCLQPQGLPMPAGFSPERS